MWCKFHVDRTTGKRVLNLIYFGSNKSISWATTNKQSQTKKFPLSQIEFGPFVTMASVPFPLYLVAMAYLPFLYACIFSVLSGGFFVAMKDSPFTPYFI